MSNLGHVLVALLASCANSGETMPTVDAAIKAGDTIFLKSSEGTTVTVHPHDLSIHAQWTHHGLWQSFTLQKDGEDDAIFSGDTVHLRTALGRWVSSKAGNLYVRDGKPGPKQALTIENDGGGFIKSGDTIYLKTHEGNYISADKRSMHAKTDDRGRTQRFIIEEDVPSPFDGRWTEKADPGRDIFVIKRDAMHFVDWIETTITPDGETKFSTGLHGHTAHSNAELVDGELRWSNGDVWIPVEGKFDGHYTDLEKPERGAHAIRGNTITLEGGHTAKLTPKGTAQFTVSSSRLPDKEAELVGFELRWGNGDIWAPLQAGEFDGRWTVHVHPGGDFFDIEGEMLFFDEPVESRIKPLGNHTFQTELSGSRMHVTAQLRDGKLHWNNGDIWVPWKGQGRTYWRLNATSTTTSTSTTTGSSTASSTGTSTSTSTGTTITSTSTSTGTTPTVTATATATTTTDTVTTTTTTESSCWEKSTTYEPMDMDGSNWTFEYGVEACQDRCYKTPGCTHFSYWWLVYPGHCHLQDVYALKQYTRLGFTAGPQRCFKNVDSRKHNMVRLTQKGVGSNTFVPYAYRCLEMGNSYTPATRTFVVNRTKFRKAKQAVKECMRACAAQPGCAHFSISFPLRICTFANEKATQMHPIFKSIAGPPSCDGVRTAVNETAAVQKFLEDRDATSRRGASSGAIAAMAAVPLAGTAFLAKRWADGCRWRRLRYGHEQIMMMDVRELAAE